MSQGGRSRGSKRNKRGKKRASGGTRLTGAFPGPTAEERRELEEQLAPFRRHQDRTDPLPAERLGAWLVAQSGEYHTRALHELLDHVEESGDQNSVSALMAIGAVTTQPPVSERAAELADQLVSRGLPRPGWAAELAEPLETLECWIITHPLTQLTAQALKLRRAGRSEAYLIHVDPFDCGAAQRITHYAGTNLAKDVHEIADKLGAPPPRRVEPAEFRWRAETALDRRAVHGLWLTHAELLLEFQLENPPYHLLATLLKARLATLPEMLVKPEQLPGHNCPLRERLEERIRKGV